MHGQAYRYWVSAGVGLALLVGSAGAAAAEQEPEATDVGATLADVAASSVSSEQDVLANGVAVSTDVAGAADGYAEVEGDVAMIPLSPEDPIIVGGDSATPLEVTVVVEQPADVQAEEVADGVVGFDADNGSVTVAVPKEDGSVQVAVVIDRADAPLEYEFALGAADDIRQYPDGSIGVYTAEGDFVGGIAAPWATDANGLSVPTHFEVRGSSIFQVVEHSATTVTYPVVADPWLGKALISKTVWSGDTLKVYPTNWAVCKHWYSICAGVAARWAAWDEVKSKTPGTKEDTASMRDQLYCHFDVVRLVAPNKESWNLDKKRPAVSYATMLQKQCNP